MDEAEWERWTGGQWTSDDKETGRRVTCRDRDDHVPLFPVSIVPISSLKGAIMRIAVLGTGALGCVFAAQLAARAEVWMLGTWAEGIAAVRRDGIRIT